MLNVVSYEDYAAHPEMWSNNMTAVDVTVGDDRYVMPFRSSMDDRPGIYNAGIIDIIKRPTENIDEYSVDNVIDLASSSMSELIMKQKQLRNIENEILTSPDNIFRPIVGENDTPEMALLKSAVISKKIDIDKYAPRLGDNYNNDKRAFKQSTITLTKMIRLADALDIEVEITMRDKSEDIANPIGTSMSAIITGGSGNDE